MLRGGSVKFIEITSFFSGSVDSKPVHSVVKSNRFEPYKAYEFLS